MYRWNLINTESDRLCSRHCKIKIRLNLIAAAVCATAEGEDGFMWYKNGTICFH